MQGNELMRPWGYTVSGDQNFDKFTSEAQVIGEVTVYQSVPRNQQVDLGPW